MSLIRIIQNICPSANLNQENQHGLGLRVSSFNNIGMSALRFISR